MGTEADTGPIGHEFLVDRHDVRTDQGGFVEKLLDNDYSANGLAAITLSLGTPRTFRRALTTD